MIIDLSSSIYNNMPHYPDDIDVKVESFNYEYFNITNINMCVHSGTHIDTPLHCINNKPSAENIDLSNADKILANTNFSPEKRAEIESILKNSNGKFTDGEAIK